MSAPGAWRRVRCPPSPPDATPTPRGAGRDAAASPDAPPAGALAPGRRLRRALAAALAAVPLLAALPFEAAAQTTPTANTDGSYTVPGDWALLPSDVAPGSKFRLLFVTSTTRHASATDIASYNSFVQTRAAAGHAAIRAYSAQFRAVGSTAAVHARDNTSTTGTGVPIYWLNGAQLADNYTDFYDGTWDSYAVRHESGASATFTPFVWTGSNDDGTAHATRPLGNTSGPGVRRGYVRSGSSPLSDSGAAKTFFSHGLFGLSPVFKVPRPTVTVEANAAAVTEKGLVQITFRRDVTSATTFVKYEVVETSTGGGDFVVDSDEGSDGRRIDSPNASDSFGIFAEFDTTDEPDGSVTVTILDGNPLTPGSSSDYIIGSPSTVTVTMKDDDPTVVTLARTGTGAVAEGGTVELTVTLGRALVAGETVDVPLAVSGTGVTTADWSLAKKAGTGLNTGVTLSGTTTATPKVRFSGAAAQTATLVLSPVVDAVAEPAGETYTVALGPDGTGPNGFDVTTLATNVGGGADPHATRNTFSVEVRESGPPEVTITRGTSPGDGGDGCELHGDRSPAPLANLPVSLTVADAAAGDFVAAGNEGAKRVTIPPSGSATYTVATVPDRVDEANGEVTVTVADGDGYTVGTAASAAVTLTDDDPTVVSLVRTGGTTGALTEGATVGLVVSLGRSLVAGETVDVPLSISGTGVTTADWSLAKKAGTGLNTGVTLSGETTATPKVRFSNAGARTATLVLTTVEDAVDEPTAETYTVALGPDGAGANGFDVTTLATNVGGGADPHATHNAFSVEVRDGVELAWAPGSLTVDEGAGTARLALELNAARAAATPVTIFYGSSGATSPQDYRRGPSRVTIAAGATRATVDIPIVDDALVEEDELFLAAIDTGRLPPDVIVARSGDYARITIRDNESDPVVTLAAASTAVLTEGTAARFTLSVAPASGPALAVNLQVADAPGADFVAAAGEGERTVTVPAGAASVDFTVATTGDRTDEPSGEVTVTLAAGEGYGRREAPPAQVRVRDDDPTQVTLSIPDATATEGDATDTAAIALALGRGLRSGERLAVPLGFSGARAVTDFTLALSGSPQGVALNGTTVVFTGAATPSAASATVLVTAADDADTAHETVTVRSGTPSPTGLDGGVTAQRSGDGRLTLFDDDGTPPPAVSIAPGGPVIEGAPATYTLIASPAPATALTVTLAVADAAGSDFVALSDEGTRTVTLPTAGTATVTVATVDDGTQESDGTVTVSVAAGSGYTVGAPASGAVTVRDDDGTTPPLPVLSIAGGPAVTEGTPARFTVTASPVPAYRERDSVGILIGVADAPGADFLPSSLEGNNGVWDFEGGAASRTFTLATRGDGTAEPSGPVTVTIRPRAGEYTVGIPASATVTVRDDDGGAPPPTVRLSAATYRAAEGDAVSVTVRLHPQRSSPTAVGLVCANETAASGDYAACPASVTIAANTASHTFTIATTEDTDDERDETFTVAVGTLPDGVAAGSPSTAVVTITDDDPTEVVLSTPDATATEGDATDTAAIGLTLGRGLVSGERLSVPLSFSGGRVRTDFTLALSGSPAGVRLSGTTVVFTGAATPSADAATVLVTAGSDRDVSDDTVTVSLGTLSATGLGPGVTGRRDGDGRIVLADASAPLSPSLTPTGLPATGLPEGAQIWFNLDLGRGLEAHETATLPLTLGGTAARGADYTLRCESTAGVSCRNLGRGAPSLIIDGSRLQSRDGNPGNVLLLTAVEDNTDEPAEPVTLRLGGGATRSFNIVDAPDAVTIEFTRPTFAVRENNGPAEPCMRVTPPSGRDIPLYFTLGGTATEGRTGDWDFHFRDNPPVLRAGQRVACLVINLHDNARDEPDKTVILDLDTARLPTGVTLEGVADPTLTILDDEPTVASLARTGRATVTEGATVGLTVTLTRALEADEVVDVPLEVSGTGVTTADWRLARAAGTALNTGVTLAREDTTTPRLRFEGAGARTATLALEAVDDGFGEGGTETFTVALGPDGAGANGFEHEDLGTNVSDGAEPHPTRNRFTVTVRDSATRAPNIRVAPGPAVTEGTAATFTVTADPVAPASDLSVTLEVADAPGSDFVAASDEGAKTVTILAGETSTTLTVPTQPDSTDEASGPVTVTVTAAGQGYATGATGAVTVADGDPTTVTLSGTSSAIAEAGGTKVLTLTLSRALVAGERLDVPVVVGGVAQHGADYRLPCVTGLGCRYLGDTGGGVYFVGGPDAVRTATLTLTAIGDGDDEGTGETVTVALGTPGGNLADGATASGSVGFDITDDDDPLPVVTIAGGAAVTEGGDAVFTLSADRAPSANLAVKVEVEDAPGSDFLAEGDEGAKTVTLGAGLTSATYTVPTQPDDADEPDGPVRATLGAGAGYRRGTASSATVEVADDDVTVLPTLSIDDPQPQAEGTGQRTGFVPGFTLMRFTIRLSAPQPHTVRVTATARDSVPVSARGGQDYIPARLLGEFWPGQTTTHIWVTIIDDSHDENNETFEVVLSDARGAAIADAVAVGTITNDDPMPAAWLARFGRTVAEQALDGIAGRLAAPRTPGMAGTLAGLPLGGAPGTWSEAGPGTGLAPSNGTGVAGPGGAGAPALGGFASSPGRLGTGGLGSTPGRLGTGGFGHDTGGFDEPQSEPLTMRDALLGSRFTLTGTADATGGSLALWGRASHGSFDGAEGTFSLDGEATTALLGADYARDGWLVGLALAQSEGEGDYRDTKTASRPASQACPGDAQDALCGGAVREGDGTVEASLTAALPYASLEASERLKLWGALGYGAGEVTLATAMGGRYGADTTWRMAAAGLRGDLLEAPAEGSGPALALTSDALWARTASEKTRDLAASASDVTRLRLGLEGSWRMALDGGDAGAAPGASLVPKLEVGARHDGGDAETGLGIELGGGLVWTDPALGLTLDVSGRTLIAHEDDDLEDRGFAAALGFDPRPESERGPSFSLRQDFGGSAQGGLDALFQSAPLDERSGSEATSRWTAQIAYGLPAFGGRYTASPHAGLGLERAARDYTLGWRWTPAENAHPLSFGLKATRRESDGAAPEHTVGFEASARW